MKSRLQSLTPNGLRKSNFLFLYFYCSVVLFLTEAARFTDSTLRRKFRSNNRFLRNFSHENLNYCPLGLFFGGLNRGLNCCKDRA